MPMAGSVYTVAQVWGAPRGLGHQDGNVTGCNRHGCRFWLFLETAGWPLAMRLAGGKDLADAALRGLVCTNYGSAVRMDAHGSHAARCRARAGGGARR